jgi:glycerophosphoryl diester phosphodiesterase
MNNTHLCIAYGGASITCPPGHTVPAIKKAIEIGATCVYLELRATRDQELVVWNSQQRLIGEEATYLTDHTLAEWQRITESDEFPILTLDQVLPIFADTGYALAIDLRSPGLENALAKKLRRSRVDYKSLLVVPGSDASKTVMRSMDPRIQLAHRFPADQTAKITGDMLMSMDCQAVVWPSAIISEQVVKTLKDRGIVVYSGPVVLGDEMRRLRNVCGVDGILTPAPDLLLDLFNRSYESLAGQSDMSEAA